MKTRDSQTHSGQALAVALVLLFAPWCGAGEWEELFDGQTLGGWKITDFVGHGKVEVKDGQIILRAGGDLTGVSIADTNSIPRLNYEVSLEAMRVDGADFFCGLTFPVRDACCTLIVGGWGGSLVGISSLDGMDASENETMRNMSFENKRWHRIRVRVTAEKLEAWIGDEQVVNVTTTGKKISMRPGEIEIAAPFSICSYQTTAALRDIKLRELDDDAAEPEAAFVSIFDGKTLKGWHVSAKTGHSRASKHASGGKWIVENGAIVGSQDIPGNGGILLTDEQFGDFEVALEMNNDFGPDSGIFLRSTEDGKAYQAHVDYHAGGTLMGIYGEGLGAKPRLRNFSFLDAPHKIAASTNAPFALPVSPEKWAAFWRHGRWNELRARIVGNPPAITTWINDVKFMEWTETEKRHPDKGGIALQVHGGGNHTNQFVRYRNIRVKKLGPAR